MMCAVESDFVAYDRRICNAKREYQAIKEWAAELYDEYINGSDRLHWVVNEVEEMIAQSIEIMHAFKRNDFEEMKALRKRFIEEIAEKHWEEEKQRRIEAKY